MPQCFLFGSQDFERNTCFFQGECSEGRIEDQDRRQHMKRAKPFVAGGNSFGFSHFEDRGDGGLIAENVCSVGFGKHCLKDRLQFGYVNSRNRKFGVNNGIVKADSQKDF